MKLEKISMVLQRLKRNVLKNRLERPWSFAIGVISVICGIAGLVLYIVCT